MAAAFLAAGFAVAETEESLAARRQAELEARIRERGLDPGDLVLPGQLNPEMRAWVRERVPAEGSPLGRLRTLLGVLTGQLGLGLEYSADITATAEEVFASRQANCLSFTQLFVSMAREVGLDAYYLEVEREPRFDREGDLVLLWEHVTAGYGPPSDRLLLEFGLGPPIRTGVSRRLSDLTALAMFYSNRGAELLRGGDDDEARRWLEVAVALDPAWAHGWVNLGVARRRAGDLAAAEDAYRAAIDVDSDHLQAFNNLATLLRLRGDRDAAGELLRLLDRRDNRDPFIYLALGDTSLGEGDLDAARRFYRRALALGRDQAEARAAMGLWAAASERPSRARRWLRRAEALDPESPRVRRLRELLAAERAAEAPVPGPVQ